MLCLLCYFLCVACCVFFLSVAVCVLYVVCWSLYVGRCLVHGIGCCLSVVAVRCAVFEVRCRMLVVGSVSLLFGVYGWCLVFADL